MYSLIVAIFCTTALQMWSIDAAYSYTCHPNNTISISGLPTDLSSMNYFAIQADGKNCTVSGDELSGTAEINDCDKDISIYFSFSSYGSMLNKQVFGGNDVETVRITCTEINSAGVADSISNSLGVNLTFREEKLLSVDYDITSALNVSFADVGDPVEWTIYFPMNYTLQITSCTAYPGLNDASSNSIGLITTWCSDVTDLISNFNTNGDNTEASSVIQAFKFYNYDNVYLTCDLKVCPADGSCVASCGGRKKRSSPAKGDDTGAQHISVGKVLRIIEPDSSSAIRSFGIGVFLNTLLTALVCLLLIQAQIAFAVYSIPL